MGPSGGEGSPIQPDGGLLSVLGDLLFAGAILVMIYPFLRRTIDRVDRNFFSQFFYIVEVLFAIAALSFVLMLLIAQQMRVTYCSFIRPYVGDKAEDKAYAGIYLKILVCALLVFNYFCASGLQRFVTVFFDWLQPGGNRARLVSTARYRRVRAISDREVLTNNSNTNSQTPVTHTLTHSDILPSMSFPAIRSDSFQEHDDSPMAHNGQRLFRDVGTMVRFPEYQNNLCNLQFCSSIMTDGPGTYSSLAPAPAAAPAPHYSSSFNTTTLSAGLRQGASMGFNAGLQGAYHSSSASEDNSYHRSVAQGTSQSGGVGLVSVRSNCQLSLATVKSHSNSALASGQTSSGQGGVLNSSYGTQTFGQTAGTQTFGQTAGTQTFGQTAETKTFGQTAGTQTFGQTAGSQTCFQNTAPCFQNTTLCFQKTAPCFQNTAPCFQNTTPCFQNTAPCFQNTAPCGQASVRSCSNSDRGSVQSHSACSHPGYQGSSHHIVAGVHSGMCVVHSGSRIPQAGCSQSVSASIFLPQQRSTVHVRRRRLRLPSMPKTTRSGKIYGYG